MGQIDFTNIVIDDFRKGKWNPFSKYVYILTHIHADHLTGLNNSWNYGPIYCSQITANLIINKFNGLKDLIKVVPLQQPYQIKLSDQLQATITFFDANHCAGAVIVLLQGYFGRFLYTGDFRFNRKIFERYTYLYPAEKINQNFEKCSKPIDKLWLDNTFCNPRFNFPNRDDAFQLVAQFIRENMGKRIYVGMDNYGKEQALIHLAQQFDTIIVVNEDRYESIIAMEYDRQHFTTNPEQGLIQVVNKKGLYEKLKENEDSLGLVMTGWCNTPYWSKNNRIYHVPYSLHSNYKEIVAFVKSVYPGLIDPVVPLDTSSASIEQNSISLQLKYSTEGNALAFRNLVKDYTSPISQLYKKNQSDPQFLTVLKQKLGLDKKTISQNQLKAAQLSMSKLLPTKGKGYKLDNERDEEELARLKKVLHEKKRMNREQLQQIIISEQQNEENQEEDQVQEVEAQQKEESKDKKEIMQEKREQKRKVNMNEMRNVRFLKGREEYLHYFYGKMKGYLLEIHQRNICKQQ